MRKVTMLVLMFMGLLLTQNAFAQESVWEKANSPEYGKKAGGMLGRGLINVATCFMDLIVQTVEGTQDGPPFVGTMTGLGGGLGCSALRVTSGALAWRYFLRRSTCVPFPEPEGPAKIKVCGFIAGAV